MSKQYCALNPTLPPHPSNPQHGHSHLAVVQQHAVHLLDCAVGSVLRLKVHECVAFGSVLITHHLQEKNSVSCMTVSD